MRQTMEVGELFNIIARRKWILIFTTIAFMILGLIYSVFLAKPVYRADTTLIVSGSTGNSANLDIGTLNVNQTIAVTYGEIVKSRAVLQTVIDDLKLKESYEDLLLKISSGPVGATEILKISVEYEDKAQAVRIANKIANIFREEASRVLKVNNIAVIDRAAADPDNINKGPIIITLLALLLGAVLGTLLTLVIDYTDNTLKTEQDIEKYLDLSVIGAVPNFKVIEKD